MALVGLDGEYLVGIEVQALSPNQVAQAKMNQLSNVVSKVADVIPKMTVSQAVSMVKSNPLASALLEGFEEYSGYRLSSLTSMMKLDSINQVMGTVVQGVAAAERAASALDLRPNTKVEFQIREQDFLELKVEECTGIMLPMFSITFSVQDKALYKSFNRSSTVKISFGKTATDVVTMAGVIFKPIIKDQEHGGIVTLRGFLDSPGFIDSEIIHFERGTSFQVIQNFLAKYNMTLTSNVEPDQYVDSMMWRSPLCRPNEYVINCWKHSFVSPESQIAPAILATGEMVWTDLSKARELANTPDYTFMYGDRIEFKQNPFYANFGSVRDQRYVFSTETNSMEDLKLNDKKSAVTTDSNQIFLAASRAGRYSILTPEMHSNWYLAELLNCSRLFSTMNQTALIRSVADWKKYKPTDIITIQSPDSHDVGQYMVCGRIAHISNRKFNTWLVIARDNYVATTGTDFKL